MELDPLDIRILHTLGHDASASLRAVARAVDSTAPTVAARLDRLRQAGLVRGSTLSLDPARLPGTTRLVTGRIAEDRTEALRGEAETLAGLLEVHLLGDGRFHAAVQVQDLDDEARILEALGALGAEDLTVRPVRRILGPPPSDLFREATVVEEPCAVCSRPVGKDPVVATVDGRRVVYCCTSCQALYQERYARMKEGAGSR